MSKKESSIGGNVRAPRFSEVAYAMNFVDAHPPLTKSLTPLDANRGCFCYDAACVKACPTSIDVLSLFHCIGQDNNHGAADAILDANQLSAMCAGQPMMGEYANWTTHPNNELRKRAGYDCAAVTEGQA